MICPMLSLQILLKLLAHAGWAFQASKGLTTSQAWWHGCMLRKERRTISTSNRILFSGSTSCIRLADQIVSLNILASNGIKNIRPEALSKSGALTRPLS